MTTSAIAFPSVEDRPYHLFTQEYVELRAAVRDLLEKRVAARADEIDRSRLLPAEILAEIGGLGYLGLVVPEDVGGGGDPVAAAVVAEELGRTGVYGLAAAAFHHVSAGLALALAGSAHQRDVHLPGLLAGRELWALAVMEPHLDPDVRATTARALPGAHGSCVLSGVKSFVPNGGTADHLLVSARVDERIALFVVEPQEVERESQELMAWWPCSAAEIRLLEAVVPPERRLEGDALETLTRVGRWQALCESLALCGLAARALETGLAYGLERKAFDRPVARFQVWRHRWADAATEVEMARALAIQALRLFVHGEPAGRSVASARLYAGRVAFELADECVQMHGGYGYMMEYPAQRFWRDARQATVVAGGDHVWLEAIATELGL